MTSRGLRNNNPGNIRLSTYVWQGEIRPSQDKSFCTFRTIAYGYRALIKTLQTYRTQYGLHSIREMVSRWAPDNENDTESYIKAVCKQLQVAPDFVPEINSRETMCNFAAAISGVENGVKANMKDVCEGWNLLIGKL